jgi:2,3-bisphosphoglycerate-dependent phosphoglycerate mutase
MNTFYLVRHAEPDHSWTEESTRPLSKSGIEDRSKIVEYFTNKKIDLLYSSPYKRAFDTVKVLADFHKINILIDERLKERIAGNDSNNKESFYKRWEDFNYAESGGESIGDVQNRNIEFIKEIDSKYNKKTIVVGTHGTALSSILNYYNTNFGCNDFLRIINFMPFIVKLEIKTNDSASINEEFYIEKEYKK